MFSRSPGRGNTPIDGSKNTSIHRSTVPFPRKTSRPLQSLHVVLHKIRSPEVFFSWILNIRTPVYFTQYPTSISTNADEYYGNQRCPTDMALSLVGKITWLTTKSSIDNTEHFRIESGCIAFGGRFVPIYHYTTRNKLLSSVLLTFKRVFQGYS